MTTGEALKKAVTLLDGAQVPSAAVDARELLASLLLRPPLAILATPDTPLAREEEARFFALVRRRMAREPLQYILGSAPFMGQLFLTSPGVLIPRQDTEALCARAIALAKPRARVLDLCCGSGCLAVSLKLARPDTEVHAGDLAQEAVALTQENASRLGADISVRRGDLFDPFIGLRFDLVLSNPPYIPSGELPGLQAEVRFEPALALDGGADGLHVYRRILYRAGDFLAPGGSLLLEVGDRLAEPLAALVKDGWAAPRIHPDLAGLPRVLETQRTGGVE